jgi:hypothetical protein
MEPMILLAKQVSFQFRYQGYALLMYKEIVIKNLLITRIICDGRGLIYQLLSCAKLCLTLRILGLNYNYGF